MTRRRYYMTHRRAYFPRVWPMLVTVVAIVAPLFSFIGPSPLISAGVSAAIATAIVQGRLWVWRRRHPVISVREMIADQQQAARWN